MEPDTETHGGQLRASQPRLTYVDAQGRHEVKVSTTSVVCGSSPSAQLQIVERTVSRMHAELELREDGLWVRDLASTNGTFVDRVRVDRARIPDGAVLRLGSVECQVSYEDGSGGHPWPAGSFGPLLGESAVMRLMFAALARAAPTVSSVLVTGETGTGKELVARALHEASPRHEGPFVIVDCAALPEHLLDAELFGHTRGAFTGAVTARVGAFEAASGGTLFLDEIGELPLPMQPKLLRALEARTVRRLGETEHRPVDVRIVAATHRDLGRMAACGAFREDLFFRLSVLPLRIPSLRERTGDIPVLLDSFLAGGARGLFSDAQLARIAELPWLGNVRELRNFAERAVAFGAAAALELVDVDRVSTPPAHGSVAPPVVAATGGPGVEPYAIFRERWIDQGEAAYVRQLLTTHAGNVANAARSAGIARAHVYRLIKKHGL